MVTPVLSPVGVSLMCLLRPPADDELVAAMFGSGAQSARHVPTSEEWRMRPYFCDIDRAVRLAVDSAKRRAIARSESNRVPSRLVGVLALRCRNTILQQCFVHSLISPILRAEQWIFSSGMVLRGSGHTMACCCTQ